MGCQISRLIKIPSRSQAGCSGQRTVCCRRVALLKEKTVVLFSLKFVYHYCNFNYVKQSARYHFTITERIHKRLNKLKNQRYGGSSSSSYQLILMSLNVYLHRWIKSPAEFEYLGQVNFHGHYNRKKKETTIASSVKLQFILNTYLLNLLDKFPIVSHYYFHHSIQKC